MQPSGVGQSERHTQSRVLALFRNELGYEYLGDWTDETDNSNIEEGLLTAYLTRSGYGAAQISRALDRLHTEANNPNRSIYDNNQAVYSLLRYGVPVQAAAGENNENVWLIDWDEPARNDFAIAEEVTLRGNHERRPDLVLYVNGIAVGVIELKNSRVSIGDGIRQNISNQQPEFNEWFFSTVQLIFAGNDSEGLQYGSIKTEEKYFLQWKEDEADNSRFKLDKYLLKMCDKARLLCSLVHKFGRRDVADFEQFIQELEVQPCQTVGELFVFVDECHRTESGKLHRTMKAIMRNAVFIGFTGTPLLKADKQTSQEVFGGYIHTYKFSEGVEDGVVLDLVYEARDIDQRLGSKDKIDAWFKNTTKTLNEWQKAALREQWGTMQKVLSSRSRMERVVDDIIFDFIDKPRLSNLRGNAILVASSIHQACKYFELFQKTVFKGRCAVVTSYNPHARDITLEDTGANTETDKEFIYSTYGALLQDVEALPGKSKTESYEDRAKKLFKEQPANMKLLVVVDKLLTGFDAPSCTYLYIDKSMQDHGLFQAICRVNRLDGDDKDFGYIVDYKDLFKKVENAIAVYTSELDHSAGGVDPEILLQERLSKGRERLDHAMEAIALLCVPVKPPQGELEHIHYFCGNTEIPTDLKAHETQRAALYKATVALVRAYANIADEMGKAGYSAADIRHIDQVLDRSLKLREMIRNASGENLDLKAYEAEIIKFRKEQADKYEEYLKKIAELATRVEVGQNPDMPEQLNTPGRRALYNNLKGSLSGVGANVAAEPAVDRALDIAIRIDAVVKHNRPDGWRGVQAKENVIKSALYGVLQDIAEVERIFLIIRQQREY